MFPFSFWASAPQTSEQFICTSDYVLLVHGICECLLLFYLQETIYLEILWDKMQEPHNKNSNTREATSSIGDLDFLSGNIY